MTFKTTTESLAALLRFARDNGAKTFRIHDGEEWAHKATALDADVIEASNSTGEDALFCYDADGKRLGYFDLVWGNCPQGSDLVSNYGVNDFTEATFAGWFKASEDDAA